MFQKCSLKLITNSKLEVFITPGFGVKIAIISSLNESLNTLNYFLDWKDDIKRNRRSKSDVFNSGQKMALRTFYFTGPVDILLHKVLSAPSFGRY